MSEIFNAYNAAVDRITNPRISPEEGWKLVNDWYSSEGRLQFIRAFTKETGLRLDSSLSTNGLVEAAIPKDRKDWSDKLLSDAFYRAHAFWFIEEMDYIMDTIPRKGQTQETFAFRDLSRFVRALLLDSVLLFEWWGRYRAKAPSVYGIDRSDAEFSIVFYQGAKQIIYGHDTPGLSSGGNHSDLAIGVIRQAVEIRLRRAFGVTARVEKKNGRIHPINLSQLIDAIKPYKQLIRFPVLFENIDRINGWSNIYLHSGLKLFAWCAPRMLSFLHIFLVGGKAPGWVHHSHGGIVLDVPTFDSVRAALQGGVDPTEFEIPLWDAANCDVIFQV